LFCIRLKEGQDKQINSILNNKDSFFSFFRSISTINDEVANTTATPYNCRIAKIFYFSLKTTQNTNNSAILPPFTPSLTKLFCDICALNERAKGK
jgi:hypothetical protein